MDNFIKDLERFDAASRKLFAADVPAEILVLAAAQAAVIHDLASMVLEALGRHDRQRDPWICQQGPRYDMGR